MFKSYSEYVSKKANLQREYIDNNKKLVEKPKELDCDYDGPEDKAPVKTSGAVESPAPYKPANAAEKAKPAEKGLADLGNKNFVYNPDTKGGNSKLYPGGTEVKGDWSTKTESFIRKTSRLSPSEFAKFMLKESVQIDINEMPFLASYEGNLKIKPHPSDVARYVANISKLDSRITEQFIHEIKRTGQFRSLLESILLHPEAYEELASLFENDEGEKRSRLFAKALVKSHKRMEEAVGPPMGLDQEDEPELEGKPNRNKHFGMDDSDNGSDDGSDDEENLDDEDFLDDEEPSEEDNDDEAGLDDSEKDFGSDEEDEEDMGMPSRPSIKSGQSNLFGAMKHHMGQY